MDVEQHYRNLVRKHGDSAESAQYSDRASQEKRFEILSQIGSLQGKKILDFGCGTAHFATWLETRGIEVDYVGVDIVTDFFEFGKRKHPQHRFALWEEVATEEFDYAFVSGVFNNVREDNELFYQGVVRRLFSQVRTGLAFNLMSSYVDYRDEGLYYVDPETVFSFVKSELTPLVCLRHDYRVKPDVIPFEFAVYAYKETATER